MSAPYFYLSSPLPTFCLALILTRVRLTKSWRKTADCKTYFACTFIIHFLLLCSAACVDKYQRAQIRSFSSYTLNNCTVLRRKSPKNFKYSAFYTMATMCTVRAVYSKLKFHHTTSTTYESLCYLFSLL